MFFAILKEIFYVLSGLCAIFFVMELVWPNIILAYININILLLVWLIIGILILVFSKKSR